MNHQLFPDSPLSIWLDAYGDYTPTPPMRGNRTVDVAVIGGGFTGVMTAYWLKRSEPSLRVALLEAKTIGYGASGRNGSFAMTVIGLGFEVMPLLMGQDRFKAAHRYMMSAVDNMEALIRDERLECDCIRPGFLRVATTRGYIKRLQKQVEHMNALGFEDLSWLDQGETRQRVNSPRYLGAMWEPRLLLLNPARLVRAERDLALRQGVEVYESTPVLEITGRPNFRLKTPEGELVTEKLVFGTNAYSHIFPQLRRKQVPAFTYMIATEPLSHRQLEPVGWAGCEGLEDARNLIHYYRITPDQRVVIGGGPVGLTYGNDLNGDSSESAWRHLEEHLHWLFPSLADARITHRWGGPFSVTVNLTPSLGYVGDQRAVYSLGCIGHGVSASHENARVLSNLILERPVGPECPFQNHRVIPWPPEPLRMGVAMALRSYLQLEDWAYERELQKQE